MDYAEPSAQMHRLAQAEDKDHAWYSCPGRTMTILKILEKKKNDVPSALSIIVIYWKLDLWYLGQFMKYMAEERTTIENM